MSHRLFVTGTDTGVGKTEISAAILHAANHRGLSTLGLKPVAAGCEYQQGELVNEDALLLQQHASLSLEYALINPVRLVAAMAPHLAAEQQGVRLQVSDLVKACEPGLGAGADLTLVEGAGGWRVPLNEEETLADLARVLHLPVILVIGMRLGCLNHALLTAEAIQADGLELAGWVANAMEPRMLCEDENFETLQTMMPAPCLGRTHWINGEHRTAALADQLYLGPLSI